MMRSDAPARRYRRTGGLFGGVLICLVLASIVGSLGYYFVYDNSDGDQTKNLIVEVVRRAPFDHVVLEQGEIESSSNIEILCQVESRGAASGVAILWVIDEGTRVKKGDKLVELDSSQLDLELKENRIEVVTAEAAVSTAQALLEQATITRQEYLEGVYQTEEKAIQSEMAIAEQELRKAQLALGSSERLVAKGLVKSLQLEADKFAVANAQNQLEAAKGRLRVLQNLTRKKMLVQFDSDINAAEAGLVAARSKLMEEQQELAQVEQQIEMCVMYAPADGVVVHANRYSGRGGNAEFVVEAGATVRERQAIIQLPDPSKMQVRCKVNESRITLIQEGMAAKVTVDALPGVDLKGRVVKVNRYAEPSSFFSSSIKEYATLVEIIDPPDSIRTGMTSEVQIFVEQLADAVQIPIQGLYEHGGEMFALVHAGGNRFETRSVKMGATNDTMATIAEGLEEGDRVVLNLREHLTLMDLPEVVREDNSDMRDIAIDHARSATEDGPSASGRGVQSDGGEGRRGPRGGGLRGEGPRGEGPRGEGPRGEGPRGEGPRGEGPRGEGPRGEGPRDAAEATEPATPDSKLAIETDQADGGSQESLSATDSDSDEQVTRVELTQPMSERTVPSGDG